MTKYTFNLLKYSLKVQVAKRRKLPGETTLFEDLSAIGSKRAGNKASRIARIILDRFNIKSLLGRNIAFAALTTSLIMPSGTSLAQTQISEPVEATVLTVEQKLTTEVVNRYPFDKPKFNQGFSFFHPGLDLGGPLGEPVYPIQNGTIELVEASRFGFGNSVIIDHQNGLKSRYAHLQKIGVKEGAEVTTKSQIGTLGSTGHSTGPHVHLEVYKEGRAINPQTILGPISQTSVK